MAMATTMAIHCYAQPPRPACTTCNPVDDATHNSSSLRALSSSAPRLLLPLLPSRRTPAPPPTHNWIRTLRSEAKEAGLAEQMKEMAAAEKRWKYQVRDGKVRAISPKQAGYACQLAEHCLLDVRPSTERQKAWVKNSVWIPVFDADNGFGAETLLKRFSNFTMGGWWSGVPLMKYNSQFIPAVMEKISLDSNVIVVCQKGLRSLAACEQLYKAGYRNLFWVEGGLDAAEEGDLNREGPQPFKFAGIGGVSEFLGWTDEQRAAGAKEAWTYRAVFFGRLVAVVLAVDALFLGAQQLGQSLHTIK